MSKISLIVTLALVILIGLSGCARPLELSQEVDREFNLNDFAGIEIYSTPGLTLGDIYNYPVDLEVTQSAEQLVSLRTNENLFQYIDVSVSQGILKIKIDRHRITTSDATLQIRVALPELESLVCNDNIVRAEVFSRAANFRAEISGASKAGLDLQTGQTEIVVSGSSDATLSGAVDDLEVRVSGASTLKADLDARNARFAAGGSSDIITRGSLADFQAEISGASTLDLEVETEQAEIELSSSSDLSGELIAGDFRLKASGASRAELQGRARAADLSASGSSDLVFPDFQVQEAGVVLSGASDAEIQVERILDVDLTDSSELVYRGDPVLEGIRVSGSSNIDHR